MITFISLLSLSLFISFLLWQNIDLSKKIYELNNFKFYVLTNPQYLDLFKTQSIIEDHHFSYTKSIVLKEVSNPVQSLKIIISLDCLACEALVKDLLDIEFNPKYTNLYIYIAAKDKGFNYERVQELSLNELHQAYSNKFKDFIIPTTQHNEIYEIYHQGEISNHIDYTPKLVLNENVLNYKMSLKDLFFNLS